MSLRMSRRWTLTSAAGLALGFTALWVSRTHARGKLAPQGQPDISPDAPVSVRYDLTTKMGAAQLPSLQKGILAMMKLDCKPTKTAPSCEYEATVTGGNPVQTGVVADAMLSPLGWKYQASIHGELPGATTQTAWDTCEHSTWFFLSWHRMELYYFERIIRKMSGDNTFTLPYWNFTVPAKGAGGADGYGARVPPEFRDRTSSLFWPYRNSRLNMAPPAKGADPAWPLCGFVVLTKEAFAQAAFFTNVLQKGGMSFGGGARTVATPPPGTVTHLPGGIGSGQIERTPHNLVHLSFGAGLPGLDSKPPSPNESLSLVDAAGAGLDPMFWPIHVNIDRAWACWQQKHKGTEPNSAFWKNRAFTFYDVQDAAPGYKKVTLTGAQVIDTAKQLQYMYDNACQNFEVPAIPGDQTEPSTGIIDDDTAAGETGGPLSATASYNGILGAAPVTLSIPLSSEIQQRIDALLAAEAPRGSILLTIGGLAIDHPSSAAYEIYINLPEGAVPEYQSPSYMSELSFFGIGHHHHASLDSQAAHEMGNSFTYDATDVIRRLVAAGEWPGERIAVTLAKTSDAVPPDCVGPDTASPSVRARFTEVTLTVY